ncbi:MAG: S1C family serine protease [Firmicutes bacterium]|jgi:S1-C subfamily serine protease|nr:S1C family serine protease [Bacillota bacterium]
MKDGEDRYDLRNYEDDVSRLQSEVDFQEDLVGNLEKKPIDSYHNIITETRPRKKGISLALIFILGIFAGIIGGIIGTYTLFLINEKPIYTYEKVNIINNKDRDNAVSVAIRKVMDSVVGITTVSTQTDFFSMEESLLEGIGTGVIVDERGYIITNSHVVNDGEVQNLYVHLYSGEQLTGELIWNDELMDLAIVKVNRSNLPVAELGNSDDLILGEIAVAIGNPLGLSFDRSATAGIISGLNRTVEVTESEVFYELIQTDASINPGNSGGPLTNIKGQVIGINTVKVNSGEGLGFAIPINSIRKIITEVIDTGSYKKVQLGIRAIDMSDFINIYGSENVPIDYGVIVHTVLDNSVAKANGLLKGDIIIAMEDEKIDNYRKLQTQLFKHEKGDEVRMFIIRKNIHMIVILKF